MCSLRTRFGTFQTFTLQLVRPQAARYHYSMPGTTAVCLRELCSRQCSDMRLCNTKGRPLACWAITVGDWFYKKYCSAQSLLTSRYSTGVGPVTRLNVRRDYDFIDLHLVNELPAGILRSVRRRIWWKIAPPSYIRNFQLVYEYEPIIVILYYIIIIIDTISTVQHVI